MRLIWFPHAGGSPTAIRNWPKLLPADVELVALRYPGRPGDRTTPAASSFQHLVAQIVDRLTGLRDRPMAFFGHSMGAVVAFEAAVILEQRFGWPVRHLFLSGRGAPDRARKTWSHDAPDDELLTSLRGLGGQHQVVLEERSFRDMFLPILRADLRLLDQYRDAAATVSAPITALAGLDDPVCSLAEARAWRHRTSGPFAFRAFPGGHFYLDDHESAVVDSVLDGLRATSWQR